MRMPFFTGKNNLCERKLYSGNFSFQGISNCQNIFLIVFIYIILREYFHYIIFAFLD